MVGRWLWPALLGLSAAAAGLITLAEVQGPIRPLLTLWFLLLCPGMAFVRLLHLRHGLYEWSIAVALSLALDALVSQTMLYLGWWSPQWALLTLIGMTVAAIAIDLANASNHRPSRSRPSLAWLRR
jgi:hypothetical protein